MNQLKKNPSGQQQKKLRLEQIVSDTIDTFKMLQPHDSVLAAVSGGPDSVAMIHLLKSLQNKFDLTIGMAHINHMLRPGESERDEKFVRKLADQLGFQTFIEKIDIADLAKTHRLSIETAGRQARYDFFNRIAKENGFTKIATGHTKDDNAEQILMNLLRGSGSKGLSGIPPCRDNLIIRPLIQVTKTRLIDFLNQYHLDYMEDSSNTDPSFLRNRIRHSLIPALERDYNGEIIDALNRLSQVVRTEDEFMDIQTQSAFKQCSTREESDIIVFSIQELKQLHPAILYRLLRMGIKRLKSDLNRISFSHLNDIVHFGFKPSRGNSLDLPGQIRIYKNSLHLQIKKENRPLRDIGMENKKQEKFRKTN